MDQRHDKVFEGLLPIGSVITTKTGTKRLMIIGRSMEDGNGRIYDYGCIPFPEGYSGGSQLYVLDHSNVGSISRVGYTNMAEVELEDRLESLMSVQRR